MDPVDPSIYYYQLLTPLFVPIVVAIGASVVVATGRNRAHPPGWALDVWVRWWFYGAIAVGAVIVGLSFLIAPEYMATALGFDTANDYQREVAFANLGFALTAVLSVRMHVDARVALAWGYLLFLFGATFGHLYEWFAKGDHQPGNGWGIDAYDVVIPVVALLLALRQRSAERAPAAI